jgi:hypothetical protein
VVDGIEAGEPAVVEVVVELGDDVLEGRGCGVHGNPPETVVQS